MMCTSFNLGHLPLLWITPAGCPRPRARTQPLTFTHIVPHNRFRARDSQSSLPPEQLTTRGFRFPGLRWLPLPCGGGYLASCCLRVILEGFKKVMKTWAEECVCAAGGTVAGPVYSLKPSCHCGCFPKTGAEVHWWLVVGEAGGDMAGAARSNQHLLDQSWRWLTSARGEHNLGDLGEPESRRTGDVQAMRHEWSWSCKYWREQLKHLPIGTNKEVCEPTKIKKNTSKSFTVWSTLGGRI